MPAVAAKGAVVVLAIAVAAAIAAYESPQARRFAEDIRRRVAIALHALGEEINPSGRPPRFNRPEDADGFMHSSVEPGVDADEETKRRQREELMYWNALLLEKKRKENEDIGTTPMACREGSSFDDFLKADPSGEMGTYIFNTGAPIGIEGSSYLTQSQGQDNRGPASVLFASPFSDDNTPFANAQPKFDPGRMSQQLTEKLDYLAGDDEDVNVNLRTSRGSIATMAGQLIDTSEDAVPDPTVCCPRVNHLKHSHFTLSELRTPAEASASILAWAANSEDTNPNTPLPAISALPCPQEEQSRQAPENFEESRNTFSESQEASRTDTNSLAESGEGIWYTPSIFTSEADTMSIGDISTPGSWTEIENSLSEHDLDMYSA